MVLSDLLRLNYLVLFVLGCYSVSLCICDYDCVVLGLGTTFWWCCVACGCVGGLAGGCVWVVLAGGCVGGVQVVWLGFWCCYGLVTFGGFCDVC